MDNSDRFTPSGKWANHNERPRDEYGKIAGLIQAGYSMEQIIAALIKHLPDYRGMIAADVPEANYSELRDHINQCEINLGRALNNMKHAEMIAWPPVPEVKRQLDALHTIPILRELMNTRGEEADFITFASRGDNYKLLNDEGTRKASMLYNEFCRG